MDHVQEPGCILRNDTKEKAVSGDEPGTAFLHNRTLTGYETGIETFILLYGNPYMVK